MKWERTEVGKETGRSGGRGRWSQCVLNERRLNKKTKKKWKALRKHSG